MIRKSVANGSVSSVIPVKETLGFAYPLPLRPGARMTKGQRGNHGTVGPAAYTSLQVSDLLTKCFDLWILQFRQKQEILGKRWKDTLNIRAYKVNTNL